MQLTWHLANSKDMEGFNKYRNFKQEFRYRFSVDDLAFTYQIKTFGEGRFTLKTNEGKDALIEKFETESRQGLGCKILLCKSRLYRWFWRFFQGYLETWRHLLKLLWILHTDFWQFAYTFCWAGVYLQSSRHEQSTGFTYLILAIGVEHITFLIIPSHPSNNLPTQADLSNSPRRRSTKTRSTHNMSSGMHAFVAF